MDITGESEETKQAYGLEREEPTIKAARGGGTGSYKSLRKIAACAAARGAWSALREYLSCLMGSSLNLDVELPWNAGMATSRSRRCLRI